MFLTKFDLLTPPVTLYFKGELQHTSIVSAILSILAYLSSIVIGLLLSLDFFKRKNPTVFCFNRYVDDSGSFTFDSNGIFSNFQILDTKYALPRELDFTILRVVGTELSIQTYIERNHTARDDHWLYGLCDNGTDIEGIKYLYDYNNFNQSYCVKKYYRADESKYYSIGDEKFRWPITNHGTSHPNKTFYGIVFEACKEDEIWQEVTGGKKCKTQDEIDDYLNTHYVRFYMIDHYPDVYNYKSPFKKYFYNIDTTLSSGSYTYNHINFDPSSIITHNGLIFDDSIDEDAYILEQNSPETGTYHGAYLSYYFWLKNRIVFYERTYKRLQDVLAEIEGMGDLIIFIATIINNFISEYVTLKDTSHVLFTLRSKNVNRTEIKRILQCKRRTMFIKDCPPRRNFTPFNYSYNVNKNNDNLEKTKNFNNNPQKMVYYRPTKKRHISYKRAIPNNRTNYFENSGVSGNSGISNLKGSSTLIKDKSFSRVDADIYTNIEKKDTPKHEGVGQIENVADENIMPSFDPFKETKLSFIEFTYNYLFICKRKENSIESYENFRMKIISEENMIQNYLDIHNLNKSVRQSTKEDGAG